MSTSSVQVREGLLQDTVRQVTARGERRARLLQAVTEKAEEQARVWRDYHRLARDNTQLRRDLQVRTLKEPRPFCRPVYAPLPRLGIR